MLQAMTEISHSEQTFRSNHMSTDLTCYYSVKGESANYRMNLPDFKILNDKFVAYLEAHQSIQVSKKNKKTFLKRVNMLPGIQS